ncbi:MAG: phosphatase PAP2 family protein [Microgenomates group bacterium]
MPNVLITFLASFLIYILFAGLFILWFIDGKIKKEQVIHALFACVGAWLIAALIKEVYPTVRPFLVNGSDILTMTIPKDGAFPSEHTTLAFALAVTVFMHDRRVGWIFLISAFLVGVARVLANVHYPIDIIGGALLGTLVAIVVEKTHLFQLLRGRKS